MYLRGFWIGKCEVRSRKRTTTSNREDGGKRSTRARGCTRQPRRLQRDRGTTWPARIQQSRCTRRGLVSSACLCTLPPRPSASFDYCVRICDRLLARCGAVFRRARSSSVFIVAVKLKKKKNICEIGEIFLVIAVKLKKEKKIDAKSVESHTPVERSTMSLICYRDASGNRDLRRAIHERASETLMHANC